jgi:hypothetical protein
MNSLKRLGPVTLLALLFIVSLLANTALAQTTRGSIAGVVTDTAGAVVAGATVTATPEAGGEGRTVTTGDSGEYRIEALNPGFYTVTISAPTFGKVTVEKVNVRTSVVTSNNVILKVAAASENITVEASADAIQTETGELSKTIPLTAVKDLPYSSLNPYSLATTLPGVATVAARDDFTNGTSFSVNGLRPRANNYLIDGFDNNDNGIAGQAFQPTNTEAVQEVTVLTNSYSAEFGRGGGSVSNLTFRSGSNSFHGGAWEQYSGSALNAVKSEEAANGIARPPQFVQNIFGFRLGGPVIKNKLFIFGTSQWTRFYGAQSATRLKIPTEAGFQTLNGLAGNPNVDMMLAAFGSLRSTVTADNPAQNVAIGARPGCPAPCNVEYGFFTRTDTGAGPSREWTVRGDYTGEKDNIFARYTDNYSSLSPDLFANPGALPYADTLQGGPSRILGAMWSHTFSPTVLNEFRFSAQQIDFTFGPTAATLASPFAGLPTVNLANSLSARWGGFGRATFPQGRGHKTFQFQDAVSWSKGSHTMKFGADLAVLLVQDQIPFNFTGTIAVSGGGDCSAIGLATCTDLANWIDGFLGPNGTAARNFGNPRISVPTTQHAYYFQDSWKARSNLTLDFGVRYEYQPPDASNVLPYPALDRTAVATDPFQTRHQIEPDRNNWAPRVGFAYSPRFWQGLFGENKTVIRGGYGMFYDAFFTNISNNTASSSPNTLGGSITAGQVPGRGQANIVNTIGSLTASGSPLTAVTSADDRLVNPMTHQWNLNVQRELPLKLTAEVAYVGTRGQRLWVNEQLNPRVNGGARIIPTRGSLVIRGNRGDSNYHGLQTTVTRNVANFTVRGSYTWSRSIDNGSEVFVTSGGASRWQNVRDPRSDRGPSAFNRTHRGAISYSYMVPFPKNKGILSYVLGGWGTAGIISFQSGTPETVYVGGFDLNGDGEAFNDRPNVGNPSAAINYTPGCLGSTNPCSGVGFDDGSGTLVDWNTGAVGTASDFRYIIPINGNGNVTRNNFTYPGRQDWNLSVLKRINMPYREGHQIELRADMFNAFNHPNLGVDGLDGDVNSSTFLDIPSTRRGGRTMVLWAKYTF